VPQTKEARPGKTRRRHLLLNAMALGPGLVLAEVVGSVFCPLTPSRRLHCLLYRRSQPTPLAMRTSAGPSISSRGETIPEANHRERRDVPRSRKRIGRRVRRVATATPRTLRPSATPRREMRFPRRRAGSRQEASLPGWMSGPALSAKQSPQAERRRRHVVKATDTARETLRNGGTPTRRSRWGAVGVL